MSQAIRVTCSQHGDTQLTWWRAGLRNPRGTTSASKPDTRKCVAAILERMDVVLLVSSRLLSNELRIDKGGHQTLLFFFLPSRLAARLSFPQHDGFFQMLINHLRNATRTFREGAETRRKK